MTNIETIRRSVVLKHRPTAEPSERDFEIIEDAICDILVEMSLVPETPDVELEAFQLHTQPVRHVIEDQRREIGLAGFRAQARKLRYFHVNPEIARRCRVGKGLEFA